MQNHKLDTLYKELLDELLKFDVNNLTPQKEGELSQLQSFTKRVKELIDTEDESEVVIDESKVITIDPVMIKENKSVPEPPKPPLSQHIKEGLGPGCEICHSSLERIGWLGIFGKKSCINPDCKNHIPKNPK